MSRYDDRARKELEEANEGGEYGRLSALCSIAASLIEANRLARLTLVRNELIEAKQGALEATEAGDEATALGYLDVANEALQAIRELAE